MVKTTKEDFMKKLEDELTNTHKTLCAFFNKIKESENHIENKTYILSLRPHAMLYIMLVEQYIEAEMAPADYDFSDDVNAFDRHYYKILNPELKMNNTNPGYL